MGTVPIFMAEHSQALFRFHDELGELLAAERRGRAFAIPIDRARSVKDAIESVGVPHTEVDLVVVDGAAVGLGHLLRGGEAVEVHPRLDSALFPGAAALKPPMAGAPLFVADTHLGKLARHLRMAGFDCAWDNAWDDDEIAAIAGVRAAAILTRDKGLLMRREVARGRFVRATESEAQLAEVVKAFGLAPLMRPFTRCRECNVALEEVSRESVLGRLPPKVRELYTSFKRCPGCERVYWEGSHYARMRGVLARL